MRGESILIVEDEVDIAELIRFHVDREGYDAHVAGSGRTALQTVKEERPDLVILDLMLPDLDGLEICRQVKWDPSTRDIPILMVSARGEESDIVTGIELGADDYVTKPFSPRVLMARMKNILRRRSNQPEQDVTERHHLVLASGRIRIDLHQHTVHVNDHAVDLTVTEFGILRFLASRPGFVRTRDQVIAAVHGDRAVMSRRTVDVHVTALRRKLGALRGVIATVRGVGYRLAEPDDELRE